MHIYNMMPLSTKSDLMILFRTRLSLTSSMKPSWGKPCFLPRSSQQKSNQTIKSSSFHKVTRGSVALFPLHIFFCGYFLSCSDAFSMPISHLFTSFLFYPALENHSKSFLPFQVYNNLFLFCLMWCVPDCAEHFQKFGPRLSLLCLSQST